MNKDFAKKAEADRAALMTAETEAIEKALYKVMDQTDVAYGAFMKDGKMWTMYPPDDMDLAYRLVAAQVFTLSEAYGKSPMVIMAEVNGAIKEVMK